MTTRAEFITALRAALSDGSTFFSNNDLIDILELGIKEYSVHFPRVMEGGIETDAATQYYNIGTELSIYDVREILSAEYPADANPADTTILKRGNWRHPEFFSTSGLYDLNSSYSVTAGNPIINQIIISDSPAAGEEIRITFLTGHEIPSGDAVTLTIPTEHEPLVTAYCIWRCFTALMNNEQMAPTSANALLSSQFGENANRAWNTYQEILADAKSARSKSSTVNWKMDKWDI